MLSDITALLKDCACTAGVHVGPFKFKTIGYNRFKFCCNCMEVV